MMVNKEQRKEYKKEYYQKNKEQILEYRQKNKEKIKEQKKEYYKKNKEKNKEKKKEYYKKNKEKLKEQNKEYRQKNKEKLKEQNKEYYKKNKEKLKEYKQKNKEQLKEYKKEYNKKNKEKLKEQVYERYQKDMNFKLRCVLRQRIRKAIKSQAAIKSNKSIELLGCSIPKVRQHLEKKFVDGMSWENHGEWHIDHIKPCASFDLTDPKQQKECFNYKNLQPLWAEENLTKGAKIIE